jgi:hypothetical protein
MTHECNNPDCPIHGTSPQAVADRKLRQHLVTNEEVMNALRVIAANVHSNILANAGIQEGFMEEQIQMGILKGAMDDDPVVQGIMQGMIVLLRDHYPTQQFVGLCAAVPPEQSLFKVKLGREINDMPGIQVHMIRGFDELFEFLTGRKR